MSPEVQIWLDKAEEDWLAAGWLLQEDSPVVLPAIFHIQQAAEKLLLFEQPWNRFRKEA